MHGYESPCYSRSLLLQFSKDKRILFQLKRQRKRCKEAYVSLQAIRTNSTVKLQQNPTVLFEAAHIWNKQTIRVIVTKTLIKCNL